MDLYPVRENGLFNGDKTILAGANADSEVIDLEHTSPQGMFALHMILTGTGTAKITYKLCSTEDGAFVTPEDAVDIKTALTVGTMYKSFEPELAKYMIINVEETGGANSITVGELSKLLYQ
jgi:hypothetical protein